ncbi:MAG: glucose-6-phosphate isomerase [Candidatus Diapherotrites archaeon]|nr:glucose-6-phosphate isomerase [Candidatus Diapherotrites archaeon]
MESVEKKLLFSGLPLNLRDNQLVFGDGMEKIEPRARLFGDLEPVFSQKTSNPQKAAYLMYRGVCLEKDRQKIAENNLRYDITVIPNAIVGGEFVKTFGHTHPHHIVHGEGLAFPEIYEVISGKAHFVLQFESEFVVFEAFGGEKVLICPGATHVTINPTSEPLVLANWVEKNFESDYEGIRVKKGAAFFETTQGWKKNPAYSESFSFRFMRPKAVKEFGLVKSKPMYSLVDEIMVLDFLKHPHGFEKIFSGYLEA